ncbi:hypothetical protein VNO78_22015 [Psophocarpus tetragonolobus]|uniref:Uncharacterized protein n=1 Tax=Psophocarpus tetragonolobus TaxID=3891 RepID=A0AAN9XIK6_PSOTE
MQPKIQVHFPVGIGPKKTMIEHECPYWSPPNSHDLLRNFHKSRYISSRRSNKLNETLHLDDANQGVCALHSTLFKSPTLNHYTTWMDHTSWDLLALKQLQPTKRFIHLENLEMFYNRFKKDEIVLTN